MQAVALPVTKGVCLFANTCVLQVGAMDSSPSQGVSWQARLWQWLGAGPLSRGGQPGLGHRPSVPWCSGLGAGDCHPEPWLPPWQRAWPQPGTGGKEGLLALLGFPLLPCDYSAAVSGTCVETNGPELSSAASAPTLLSCISAQACAFRFVLSKLQHG